MLAEEFDYGGFADPEECQEAGQLHTGDGVLCYVFKDGSVLVAEEAPEQHVDVLGTYVSLELARAEHPELPLVADPPVPPETPTPPPPLDPWTPVPDLRQAEYGDITYHAATTGVSLSSAEIDALPGELVLHRWIAARAWMNSEQGRWAVEPRRSLYKMPADWQPTAEGWRADAARKGISSADLDRIQERIPHVWAPRSTEGLLFELEQRLHARDVDGFLAAVRLNRGVMLHQERHSPTTDMVEGFQFPGQEHILLVDWKRKDIRWCGPVRTAELGFVLGREAEGLRPHVHRWKSLWQSYRPLLPSVDWAARTRQLCDQALAEMAKYPENWVPDLPQPEYRPGDDAWDE